MKRTWRKRRIKRSHVLGYRLDITFTVERDSHGPHPQAWYIIGMLPTPTLLEALKL
tara:strand:- start:810 stop:977 length:168 start_codon:yes stop_codon:yes gene_type:complete